MKPDDITDEEWNEAEQWLKARRFDLTGALTAQNALRDRRVVEEAKREERARCLSIVDVYAGRDHDQLARLIAKGSSS